MSTIVVINGQTPLDPGGYQDGVTLKNLGPGTIYVDSAPVTNGAGFPIGQGTSMQRDAKRPLFANGDGGQLLMSENTGAIFDAGAVAEQLTQSGLASNIAGEILDSGLANAVAERISIEGAPPINKMVLIASGSTNSTATFSGFGAYNSVYVLWRGAPAVGVAGRRVTLDYGSVSDTGGKMAEAKHFEWLHPSRRGRVKIPIDTLVDEMTIATDGPTIYYEVYGLTDVLNSPEYWYFPVITSGGAGDIENLTNPSGTTDNNGVGDVYRVTGTDTSTRVLRIPHGNGLHRLQIAQQPSTSNSQYNIQLMSHNLDVVNKLTMSGGTFGSIDVVLPAAPLQVEYDLSAGSSFVISLTPLP